MTTSASGVDFSCRLPLATWTDTYDGSGGYLTTGFIRFPEGGLTAESTGTFVSEAPGGIVTSVAVPHLRGDYRVATYTKRYGRWLPANIAAVSPDSSHYAYMEMYAQSQSPRSRIHVVDVATGADRVVFDHGFYGVIDYEADGIYLFSVGYADAPNSGLWRLDPQAGSLKAIVGAHTVDFVGAGAAWYSDLAPGDQPPNLDPMSRAFFKDRVMRVDLRTGVASPWLRLPGQQVHTVGVDGQGRPFVTVETVAGNATEELRVVTAPDSSKVLIAGPGAASADYIRFGPPLADNHGVWFGSSQGLFLYSSEGNFRKVASAVGDVAGRCS